MLQQSNPNYPFIGGGGLSRPSGSYVPNAPFPSVTAPALSPLPRKIKAIEYFENGLVKRVEYEN